MKRLRTSDLQAILDCAHALYGHDDFATFPQFLIELMPNVLPGAYTGYTEVDPLNRRIPRVYVTPFLDLEKWTPIFEPLVRQHPVIMYSQETGDGTAHQISDFLSQQEYHRLALYNDFYKTIGVEDQLSISLPAPTGSVIGLSISRDSWKFSERDREIMNALRPHLLQAYRNAAIKTQLADAARAAQDALNHLPVGVVKLDRNHRVKLITQPAQRLLKTYYGNNGALPEEITNYARSLAGVPGPPLTIRRDRSHLIVQTLAPDGTTGELTLLLSDHPSAPPKPATARARYFGLTAREAEVLDWLAEGKSNSEIAIILSISPRTVQKHLEHAFEKLSVESRSAALLRLLEPMEQNWGGSR